MENKTTLKYYSLGAVVLIAVIIVAALLMGKAQPTAQKAQSMNTANTSAAVAPVTSVTPPPSNPAPEANAPAVTAPVTPATTPPVAANPVSTPAASPAAKVLIGTWDSSTPGKGMQGSGKAGLNGITYQLSLAGDVNLVLNQVENNTGTGTITFNNVCVSGTKTLPGKPAVAIKEQCVKTYSQPAVMQIDGNKITYSGQSQLGADITLTGTYTGDSMTGTFVRTSTSGSINGTFDLTRTK